MIVKLYRWKGKATLSTTGPSGATSLSIWSSCWASRSAARIFSSVSSSPKLGSSPGTSGQHRYRQEQMQPSQGHSREHQGCLLGKQGELTFSSCMLLLHTLEDLKGAYGQASSRRAFLPSEKQWCSLVREEARTERLRSRVSDKAADS